ncbi:hypothetical protein BU16DRAFT_137722 [Lophium mytilinum]|uniref:Only prolin and serin are matching in the corresponding protein n=1 Tax=Lophium mytilinum TaxID=390894 RepID=A0A6A6QFF1_9PEZI|nr:hypothetical protein BU16DRAFT_137722 [Lophium mytilinum]
MRSSLLPNLAAARQPPRITTDMPSDPSASVYSCTDSGFYSVSDGSSPLTPTFSRGHLRYPSSTSSLSSSPPTHEHIEGPNGSGKLPKLAEEPIEPEDDYMLVDVGELSPCLCDVEVCAHSRPSNHQSPSGRGYDLADESFGDDFEYISQHAAKRRRSGDSPVDAITNKLVNRFPSLSRRLRDRGVSGLGIGSRSSTPARAPSMSRSSSMTDSLHHGLEHVDKALSSPARSNADYPDQRSVSSPIEITKSSMRDEEEQEEEEPLHRERLASTPLLPPMMVKLRNDDLPTQSPLQSPTVADATFSFNNTPAGTPQIPGFATPPLSSKPSISSFQTTRPGHLVPSSEIPPIMIADPNDEWSMKLGHANFIIYPEPYIPEVCDTVSCKQLFADWEQARRNFTKHQVRTGEYFGATSKTYMLTEKKWAEIDASWKSNNDIAIARAAQIGQEPPSSSPLEPAPLTKIPSLNDPKSEGKFPKLGDEDIVGPMVQIASQIQRRPSRKRAFLKFLNDIRFPGSFLGRSSVGVRTGR